MLLVIVVISDIWFDKDVNDVVYYTLGGIILGASSLTLAQRGHYPRYDNGEYNNDLPNNELQ